MIPSMSNLFSSDISQSVKNPFYCEITAHLFRYDLLSLKKISIKMQTIRAAAFHRVCSGSALFGYVLWNAIHIELCYVFLFERMGTPQNTHLYEPVLSKFYVVYFIQCQWI